MYQIIILPTTDTSKCSSVARFGMDVHMHAMECQREMGGGGYLMGAPTNWKEGF